MPDQNINIRKAIAADSESLWELMRQLAVFEHYIDSFAITPEIVKTGHDIYERTLCQ